MSDRRTTPLPPGADVTGRVDRARRDFLRQSGCLMLGATGAIGTASFARMLFPRVSHAPATTVVTARPEDLSVGEVNESWKRSNRLILVRDRQSIYALSAACTHLGCIPNWIPGQRCFRCPCHGSRFQADGRNSEGPAPRPLERLKIGLDERGRIVVDTAESFRGERGEWERPDSFLRYTGRG